MSSAINTCMYTPTFRIHYIPNISTDLVQNKDVILGYNGINKMDDSPSVEILFYTVQNGNIRLVTPTNANTINISI